MPDSGQPAVPSLPPKSTKSLVIFHAYVDRLHGTGTVSTAPLSLPSTDDHPSATSIKIIGIKKKTIFGQHLNNIYFCVKLPNSNSLIYYCLIKVKLFIKYSHWHPWLFCFSHQHPNWCPVPNSHITKTRLFKYVKNFTTKNWKPSDEKFW